MSPACLSTLFNVPGETSWLGWPAIVTLPFLVGCLYCRWLPRVTTRYQPSSWINLMISRTFIAQEPRSQSSYSAILNTQKVLFGPSSVGRYELRWSTTLQKCPISFHSVPFVSGKLGQPCSICVPLSRLSVPFCSGFSLSGWLTGAPPRAQCWALYIMVGTS